MIHASSKLWAALAALATLQLSGCDTLSKLGSEKKPAASSTDCEKDQPSSATSAKVECPKCPTAVAPQGPGMCEALSSLTEVPEAARVVLGDVELSRNGLALTDVDRLAAAMTGPGKAEAVDPLIATTVMLLRDRRNLRTSVLASLPADKSRQKAIGKLLKSGRLPKADSDPPELIIGWRLAELLGVDLDSTVSATSMPLPGGPVAPVRTVKIVGLLDLPGDPLVDYDSEFMMADVEDVRKIGLFRPNEWTAMRVWYKKGERASGMLVLHDALSKEQSVQFVSVDQRLIALNPLRPTLEAMCAK